MPAISKYKLIFMTPILILLSHYFAMLPHEYAHSFMAWVLGYKTNPLALTYGGTSWLNLLLLSHMDENVNYEVMFATGHGVQVALVAFAGAGLANGSLFLLSLFLLQSNKIQRKPYLFYFFFFFNLMNLGNLYDYVPIRTFTTHGDAVHFWMGLGISPWWMYLVFGYITFFFIWYFFAKTLILTYKTLSIRTVLGQASLMIISVLILFGFFGMSGLFHYGNISYFLSATSLFGIPGIIISLWPSRQWVKQRLASL